MKKRILTIFLSIVLFLSIIGVYYINSPKYYLNKEAKLSFKYFWEQANLDENSPGYGLVRDRYPGDSQIASIAATGFGLAAIPIGVENDWISYEEGYKRAEKTLDTILNMENFHGFYYHFVNMDTGEREWNSEVSSIDTALLMCGVITVGEYFGGQVKEKSDKIFNRVNWDIFVDKNRNMFYMSYSPEKGFQGYWDFYAEQLVMYILAAGSKAHPIDPEVYYSFIRHKGSYKGDEFIHSWFGSIFTYQYSHAFVDFRNLVDRDDVNWYKNSVDASLANYNYSIDQGEKFKTYGKDSWGITACDTPHGYDGTLGAEPSGYDNTAHNVDGTIAPCGAIGSIVFTPKESISALKHFYKIKDLVGEYGLKDAYNLDENWVATDYIGIDKGITLLMIANYQNELIWKNFMKNQYVQNGLKRLQFKNLK